MSHSSQSAVEDITGSRQTSWGLTSGWSSRAGRLLEAQVFYSISGISHWGVSRTTGPQQKGRSCKGWKGQRRLYLRPYASLRGYFPWKKSSTMLFRQDTACWHLSTASLVAKTLAR
eukprot:1145878-Pelagomonas_calceolata.AAC.1